LLRVDPEYNSQKWGGCGHVEDTNRKFQERFECVSYGHRENADLNAVKSILAAELAVASCGEATLRAPTKLEARKRKAAKTAYVGGIPPLQGGEDINF
jgi:transposase